MSTVTHLQQFRKLRRFEQPSPLDPAGKLRELWNDSLATVAVVVLASIVIFQTLPILF
jgi:hypothetical protein